jgi:hypothetical protein
MPFVRVFVLLFALSSASPAAAQDPETHPDVEFFGGRPAGGVLSGRADGTIAVYEDGAFREGIPALVTSSSGGVFPSEGGAACTMTIPDRDRDSWRVHFAPPVATSSFGALGFRDERAVGVSASEMCLRSTPPSGALTLPIDVTEFGLEAGEDSVWMSASGQFFAFSFTAPDGGVDTARILTADRTGEAVDFAISCDGSDPAGILVDVSGSSPRPSSTEVAILAPGATSCLLGADLCEGYSGGLFVCQTTWVSDAVTLACAGSAPRILVVLSPATRSEFDTDPRSNFCEVGSSVGFPDAGVKPHDGGMPLDDGGLGSFDAGDGANAHTDANVPRRDGSNASDAGELREDSGDAPPTGPSFQGGGGCTCSAGASRFDAAWFVMLAVWSMRRRAR